jgi:hypothetical protein
MIREWAYRGEGWFDYWTSSCLRCMIVRHPRHDAGYHMIWIDGECIAKADNLAFAKWKAHNYLEGMNA